MSITIKCTLKVYPCCVFHMGKAEAILFSDRKIITVSDTVRDNKVKHFPFLCSGLRVSFRQCFQLLNRSMGIRVGKA